MNWLQRITDAEGFQLDAGNDIKSLIKHQVDCLEAEQLFRNHPLIIQDDAPHSRSEPRARAFGKSDAGRMLSVSFTIREKWIRVISARPMAAKERKIYEQIL